MKCNVACKSILMHNLCFICIKQSHMLSSAHEHTHREHTHTQRSSINIIELLIKYIWLFNILEQKYSAIIHEQMVTRKRKYEKENMSEQLNNLKKKKRRKGFEFFMWKDSNYATMCENIILWKMKIKSWNYENQWNILCFKSTIDRY